MGEKTRRNLYEDLVAEAKAHFHLLAYAEKEDLMTLHKGRPGAVPFPGSATRRYRGSPVWE